MIDIPLTFNQAEALRADISEINALAQAHQMKVIQHARHRNALVKDNGIDPDEMDSFEVIEVNKNFYLRFMVKKVAE